MGYYSAGDIGGATLPSHGKNKAQTGWQAPQLAPTAAPNEAPRRRTQVINLTALRRAFRRIDRATRVSHKLFSMQKHGTHGLKFKRKRRAK